MSVCAPGGVVNCTKIPADDVIFNGEVNKFDPKGLMVKDRQTGRQTHKHTGRQQRGCVETLAVVKQRTGTCSTKMLSYLSCFVSLEVLCKRKRKSEKPLNILLKENNNLGTNKIYHKLICLVLFPLSLFIYKLINDLGSFDPDALK